MFQADVHVLATVYNEEAFLSASIASYLPYVKSLTIVEGAYLETAALGAPLRSSDKTLKIAQSFLGKNSKVQLIEANAKSDMHQRNLGLEMLKRTHGTNSWLLIVDGDEIYNPMTLRMVDALSRKMAYSNARAAYFTSLTFVNDFDHYCIQQFPRLFKLTDKCQFVNDNFMSWEDGTQWSPPAVVKAPLIQFYHYSFCKGKERFLLKKNWWQTRFGQHFDYGWEIGQNGQITDKSHNIVKFEGDHPKVIHQHPLWKKYEETRSNV